jgi:hypothetical protein
VLTGLPTRQTQDKAKSVVDGLQQLAAQLASRLGEELTIDGDDLRQIGDRIFREPRGPGHALLAEALARNRL